MYGFQFILADIRPKEFLYTFPEVTVHNDVTAAGVYKRLHELDLPFRMICNGDTLDFGDVKMSVFQRTGEELSGNTLSSMLKIELGERSILFTADIQMDAQRLYVADNTPIQADIMKYPHHGYNQMQPRFLEAVDPKLVIVTRAPAFAEGVGILRNEKIPFHYTNLGIMRLATDGNVWTPERFKWP